MVRDLTAFRGSKGEPGAKALFYLVFFRGAEAPRFHRKASPGIEKDAEKWLLSEPRFSAPSFDPAGSMPVGS